VRRAFILEQQTNTTKRTHHASSMRAGLTWERRGGGQCLPPCTRVPGVMTSERHLQVPLGLQCVPRSLVPLWCTAAHPHHVEANKGEVGARKGLQRMLPAIQCQVHVAVVQRDGVQ
jgi:hypothetical protein